MKIHKLIVLILCTSFCNTSAYAALLSRAGGAMLYDTDLNITWLADANYSFTSGYDSDGRMDWFNASNWANNLVFGGFTDWRLPTTTQPDPDCSFRNSVVDGGYNCLASEMGHLYYQELSGTATSPNLGQPYFSNLQLENYWSSTTVAPSDPDNSWYFNFGTGWQGGQLQTPYEFYALAVRNGDVTTVPLPPSILLFCAGILFIGNRINSSQSKKTL